MRLRAEAGTRVDPTEQEETAEATEDTDVTDAEEVADETDVEVDPQAAHQADQEDRTETVEVTTEPNSLTATPP